MGLVVAHDVGSFDISAAAGVDTAAAVPYSHKWVGHSQAKVVDHR